nr:RHS repeat-associated core domain-containing protein [Clostridium akagii]
MIATSGSLSATVGAANPYRYKGYRYDSETGLYYLQSRYYNPDWGRFINADDSNQLKNENSDFLDYNTFAYCNNNPVNKIDDDGHFAFALGIYFVPGVGEFAIGVTVVAIVGYAVYSGVSYARKISNNRSSPEENGTPNSTKLKRGASGKLEGYSTYGTNGKLRKQVRLTGKAHGNILRPNVKVPRYNVNPKTKQKYKNGYSVRAARKYELPKGYR